MKLIKSLFVVVLLVLAAAEVSALPDVEEVITVTGDFQFAGPLGSDPSPDLVEVAAVGGEATVWFFDTSPTPDVRWPSGENPPWWPAGGTVGVNYFTIPDGLPRPFDVRGTGVDMIHVVMGTATEVIVSCSKKR